MPCTVSTPGRTRQHQETGRAGKNTLALIHTRLFLTWGMGAWADIDNCWWPPHDTHFHTIHQSNPPSFTLSTISQHALAWGHSAIVPTSLFWDCVVGTLPAGSLTETHKMWLWIKREATVSETAERSSFFGTMESCFQVFGRKKWKRKQLIPVFSSWQFYHWFFCQVCVFENWVTLFVFSWMLRLSSVC